MKKEIVKELKESLSGLVLFVEIDDITGEAKKSSVKVARLATYEISKLMKLIKKLAK